MSSPKVYISILNWNGLDDTIECLESVFKMDYDNYHVVVVDNNSSDNSVTVLRELYPNIHLIENKINTGFTGGNNIAIDYAIKNSADYVWLLNNDTVVDTSSLKTLSNKEKSNRIGMLSSVIYFFEDMSKKQFSGCRVDWTDFKIYSPDLTNEIANEYLTGNNVCLWGTALLIKAELITKIGLLEEQYFAYWEDIEYSLRSISAGYQNIVVTASVILHKAPIIGHRKSNHYHYYMIRNKLLMQEKYNNFSNRYTFYWKQLAELILGNVALVHNNDTEYAIARINGYWDALKHVSGQMGTFKYSKLNIIILSLSKKYPYFLTNIMLGNWSVLFNQIRNKILVKSGNKDG